jgi:hypothetical protein
MFTYENPVNNPGLVVGDELMHDGPWHSKVPPLKSAREISITIWYRRNLFVMVTSK